MQIDQIRVPRFTFTPIGFPFTWVIPAPYIGMYPVGPVEPSLDIDGGHAYDVFTDPAIDGGLAGSVFTSAVDGGTA